MLTDRGINMTMFLTQLTWRNYVSALPLPASQEVMSLAREDDNSSGSSSDSGAYILLYLTLNKCRFAVALPACCF